MVVVLISRLRQLAKENQDGYTVFVRYGKVMPYDYKKHGRYIVPVTDGIKIISDCYTGIVGGWYDKDDDRYVIDKNKAYHFKEMALLLAKKYSQKAIYDMKDKKVIGVE